LGNEGPDGIKLDCGLLETLGQIEAEHLGEPDALPVGTGASALIAHELGHLYGLGHVTDPLALMAPDGCCSRAPALTDADLAEWYRVNPEAI